MPSSNLSGHGKSRGFGAYRSILVAVGITLFAIGFMITLNELSLAGPGAHGATQGTDGPSGDLSRDSTLTALGLSTSLAGIALATVGPAASFISARRQKN